MQPKGYVYSPDNRLSCRITAWGAKNVSIKVYGGASKAIGRDKATNGELITWMLAGFPERLRPGKTTTPQPAVAASSS